MVLFATGMCIAKKIGKNTNILLKKQAEIHTPHIRCGVYVFRKPYERYRNR